MGLLDLLRDIGTKPWDMADGRLPNEKAINAVRAVASEKRLFRIAMNAKSMDARGEAALRITDPDMLLQLSRQRHYKVRQGCVRNENFTDRPRLREMALHDPDSLIRLWALEKLGDEMLSAQALASENAEETLILKRVFAKIHSEEAFFHIAKNRRDSGEYFQDYQDPATDFWVSRAEGTPIVALSVAAINNRSLLQRLVEEAVFEGSREVALAKLNSPGFNDRIAAGDSPA